MLTDLELCRVAIEAYTPDKSLDFFSLEGKYTFFADETDTKGVCRWFPETREAVIGFAGTESLADIVTDIRVIYDDFPGGGKVHRGVHRAAGSVSANLMEWAIEKKPALITCVGHSLGGGVAKDMTARLHSLKDRVWAVRCRTFGGMRIGDDDFAKNLAGVDVVDYVLGRDPVPHIPHWLVPGPDRLGNGVLDPIVATVSIGRTIKLSPRWWWIANHPLARYEMALSKGWFVAGG